MTEQDNHTCEVYHFDLYGTREEKYDYLRTHDLNTVEWQQLTPQAPSFFFVPKDFSLQQEYEQGFKIDELFSIGSMGIASGDDAHLVSIDIDSVYGNYILSDKFYYHPFDVRFTKFDNDLLQRARYKLMANYMKGENIGLNIVRQSKGKGVEVLVTDTISNRDLVTNHTFNYPLFLYPEEGSIETERRVNMDEAIVAKIMLGARSSSPAHDNYPATNAGGDDRAPSENNALAIFDYIYGILHSPTYRAKYKEFLKVDFPRIPYPDALCEGQIGKTFATPADAFEHYRFYGERLRKLHLMEQNTMQTLADQYKDIAIFPNGGSMVVENVSFIAGEDDRAPSVRINDTQYFANVPAAAWNFYIGGYQPAQKWLKDRKGRTLTFDDIQHYRQIITVLIETARLMAEI